MTKQYTEDDIRKAISYKNDNPKESIRSISLKFQIPPTTFIRRCKNNRNQRDAQEERQKFSKSEEMRLVEIIKERLLRNESFNRTKCIELAQGLLSEKFDTLAAEEQETFDKEDYVHLGRHWFQRFLIRHPELRLDINGNRILTSTTDTANAALDVYMNSNNNNNSSNDNDVDDVELPSDGLTDPRILENSEMDIDFTFLNIASDPLNQLDAASLTSFKTRLTEVMESNEYSGGVKELIGYLMEKLETAAKKDTLT